MIRKVCFVSALLAAVPAAAEVRIGGNASIDAWSDSQVALAAGSHSRAYAESGVLSGDIRTSGNARVSAGVGSQVAAALGSRVTAQAGVGVVSGSASLGSVNVHAYVPAQAAFATNLWGSVKSCVGCIVTR